MVILRTKDVSKVYGKNDNQVRALINVNISIMQGEFVGIMGPSGCGKTTLLNLLAGFDKPSQGHIEIADSNIESLDDDGMPEFRRNNLGFVFQDFQLMNSLTLKENVALPLILGKREPEEIENRVANVMNYLEIANLATKYPYEASGGEKQRAAVARAIINNPKIVLADEPTGNLDSKSSYNIINTFVKLNKKLATILMVTHDPFMASFCQRVIFLYDGQIHKTIVRGKDRKDFLDAIIRYQVELGGEIDELF